MTMKTLAGSVAALVLAVSVGWAGPATKAERSKDPVLKAGHYSAKVKAVVCSGCAPMIQKTMGSFPAVESVSFDQEAVKVYFKIKKGSALKLSKLQKALAEAAGRMGMGADYTLYELKFSSAHH